MATQTVFGIELKNKLLAGIKQLNHSVSSTLGPGGRTVLIKDRSGEVKVTKDGVTVAKSFHELEDQESVAPVEPNVSELPVEDLTFNDDLSLVDEVPQELEYVVQDDSLSLPESVQQIFESISSALESIPGGEQVLAAIQSVNNLGSEFTPEERREAQQVVLGAIIVSQLANPMRVK